MRNIKKILAVSTAVAAMSMSMTAFAATQTATYDNSKGLTFTYDVASNQVSATLPQAKAGTEMTLLVLDKDADDTNVQESDILYIDQQTQGTANAFQAMGLKGESLENGTYTVKLGYTAENGDFTVATGTMTLETASEGTKITIVWGDINCDGAVSVFDASAVLNRLIGGSAEFTDANQNKFTLGNTYDGYVWGDINCDGAVSVFDASAVLNRLIGGDTEFTDTNQNKIAVGNTYQLTIQK